MASSARDVAVVTPWYPTSQVPYAGAFVQAMVEATLPGIDRFTVYHCDGWFARITPENDKAIWRAHQRLMLRGPQQKATVGGARLRYLPVPVRVGMTFAESAARHAESLRIALRRRPIDAAVVHAHVGLRGGWTALQNARKDARVFVTEHATFLRSVLAEPDAKTMYDQVIDRCVRFFAVGEAVRRPLLDAFPHHADKIDLVPNPVSFAVRRPSAVAALSRWLFVGALIERKGVASLIEAFARCRAKDPALTLTLVGDGPLRATLAERARDLGVSDAVTFTGATAPHQALEIMREHDLLVHPSQFETFGMVIVEAAAAGLPVLATRCGGPEHVLAGIDDAAGELVDVEDGPDALEAGYWRLRARFPDGVDVPRARDILAGRYGYEAVRQAHHHAWFAEADRMASRLVVGAGANKAVEGR